MSDALAIDRLVSDRRLAVARRVLEAQKATSIFRVKDAWVPSRAVEQAIKETEAAFAAADYDRAEHLAEVVLRMTRRDAANFQADPKAWIARQYPSSAS